AQEVRHDALLITLPTEIEQPNPCEKASRLAAGTSLQYVDRGLPAPAQFRRYRLDRSDGRQFLYDEVRLASPDISHQNVQTGWRGLDEDLTKASRTDNWTRRLGEEAGRSMALSDCLTVKSHTRAPATLSYRRGLNALLERL